MSRDLTINLYKGCIACLLMLLNQSVFSQQATQSTKQQPANPSSQPRAIPTPLQSPRPSSQSGNQPAINPSTQQSPKPSLQSANQNLRKYEDSLLHLGRMIVNGSDETDRKAATYKYIPLLVRALKLPGSFDYPFDSVKSMRVVYAPDRSFRIFTWFVNINDIAYRFYGAIQMNTQNGLKLFPLIDATDKINNPEQIDLPPGAWYGAEYYTILPKDLKGNYVLLAWKGISEKLTSRLVDALHFEAGKPVFGAAIFQTGKQIQHRLIFRYTHQASMMLRYIQAKEMIVFDHLAPPEKNMIGKYEFYGPDLSYDAIKSEAGIWKLKENITLSNEQTEKDKSFIQPQKIPLKN